MTMKTLGDAIYLRNRVIATLEEADTECAGEGDGLLTMVVAGGGFAGVETLAALNDFVRDAVRFYPHIDPARVRMVLVHSGPVILPELGDHLGAYAQAKLLERGLEIVTNAQVAGVSHNAVTLNDGQRIPARLVVWTAGTSPHPLLASLPCPIDKGRVTVSETLRAWLGRRLVGSATAPSCGSAHRKAAPPTAQHALREAQTVATNIVATLRGDADALPLPHDRSVGGDRTTDRRRAHLRRELLRILRLVAVAHHRPGKLPRLEEGARRHRLDARPAVRQRLRAISYSEGTDHVPRPRTIASSNREAVAVASEVG